MGGRRITRPMVDNEIADEGCARSAVRSASFRWWLMATLYAIMKDVDRARFPPNSSHGGIRKVHNTPSNRCQFSILAKQSVDGLWVVRHRRGQHIAVRSNVPKQHQSAYPACLVLSYTGHINHQRSYKR